jgi:L-amino acid N-acyltransferase YncA
MSPYPSEWERHAMLPNGRAVFIRPVRPEDEGLYGDFIPHITPEDVRLRFFASVKEFSRAFIARMTRVDYDRAIAFVALDETSGKMLGVVRLHAGDDRQTGEYAILVRSDLKGYGLGWLLMQTLIDYARATGFRSIDGQVLRGNTTMLQMCRELGFTVQGEPRDPKVVSVQLDLAQQTEKAGD